MLKSELISAIAGANPELMQKDAERVVTMIFEEIASVLAEGGRVELRGFGVFAVKQRAARVGRNPRNGETVSVPEKHVPYFRCGREMHRRLNPSEKRFETKLAQ